MILSPEILKCVFENYGLNLSSKLAPFKFVDKIWEKKLKNRYFKKMDKRNEPNTTYTQLVDPLEKTVPKVVSFSLLVLLKNHIASFIYFACVFIIHLIYFINLYNIVCSITRELNLIYIFKVYQHFKKFETFTFITQLYNLNKLRVLR